MPNPDDSSKLRRKNKPAVDSVVNVDEAVDNKENDETDYDDVEIDSDDDDATTLRKKQKRRKLSKWLFKAKLSIRQVEYSKALDESWTSVMIRVANNNGLLLCDTREKKATDKKDTTVCGMRGDNDLHTDLKMFVLSMVYLLL